MCSLVAHPPPAHLPHSGSGSGLVSGLPSLGGGPLFSARIPLFGASALPYLQGKRK